MRLYKSVSNDEDEPKKSLKEIISQSASVNPKTLERNTKAIVSSIAELFGLIGVTEKDIETDPELRALLRWYLYKEDPYPYVLLEKADEPEK